MELAFWQDGGGLYSRVNGTTIMTYTNITSNVAEVTHLCWLPLHDLLVADPNVGGVMGREMQEDCMSMVGKPLSGGHGFPTTPELYRVT